MMMNVYWLLAGYGMFQFESLLFIILLLLKPFGVIMYKINYDTESYGNILNIIDKESNISGSSLIRSKKTPTGFFFSKNAIGHIESPCSYNTSEFKITIITTLKYYEYLTKKDDIQFLDTTPSTPSTPPSDVVKIYQRHGTYAEFSYIYLKLDLKGLSPYPEQKPIIDEIASDFSVTNKLSVFIEGVPCSGKSSVGYLLAKQLGAAYCHSFNPSDPGDTLSYVVSRIRRDDAEYSIVSPIIIVLEEIDVILHKIHHNTLELNNRIPTSVKDKSSWASFLDDMILYPNMILILTSNKSKEEIDAMDSAYLRKGRIHRYFKMNTPIQIPD